MTLTRHQVKRIRTILKLNKDVKEVTVTESSASGIGKNTYVAYVNGRGEQIQIDISNYESW